MEAGMYHPDGPSGMKHLILQLPEVLLGDGLQLSVHFEIASTEENFTQGLVSFQGQPISPNLGQLRGSCFSHCFLYLDLSSRSLPDSFPHLIQVSAQITSHQKCFSWSSSKVVHTYPFPITSSPRLPMTLSWFHFLHNSYQHLILFRY